MSKKYSYENKEAIKGVQEKHRKEREELKLELKDNDEDDFIPQTPRDKPSFFEGDDPRNDTDNPTYAPDSPSPTRLEENTKDFLDEQGEPEPESEDVESDDEEPEDPSAEII